MNGTWQKDGKVVRIADGVAWISVNGQPEEINDQMTFALRGSWWPEAWFPAHGWERVA